MIAERFRDRNNKGRFRSRNPGLRAGSRVGWRARKAQPVPGTSGGAAHEWP